MRGNRSSRRVARGQGLVEYALLIALIAAVGVIGLIVMGPSISSAFQHVSPGLAPTSATAVPTHRK